MADLDVAHEVRGAVGVGDAADGSWRDGCALKNAWADVRRTPAVLIGRTVRIACAAQLGSGSQPARTKTNKPPTINRVTGAPLPQLSCMPSFSKASCAAHRRARVFSQMGEGHDEIERTR